MTETTTPRPTIDFSGSSRETARRYAVEAQSRILKDESNRVLKQVAAGRPDVDAYALNAAVTDAMRAATTRHGQSMGRRALATKVAYLGHITQAVLENHADGLPVYADSGVRSRKIEEQAREIEHAGRVNQRLTEDLTKLRQERSDLTLAASAERRRLCAEIDALKEGVALATKTLEDVAEITAKRDALLAETVADRDEIAAVLAYVYAALDSESQARVQGYWDAQQEARA